MYTEKEVLHRTRIYQISIIIFLLLLFSPCTFADWQLKKDKDGIQVYTREVKESKFKEFKGIMTLSSSIESVTAVAIDVEAYPEWIYFCEMAKIISPANAETILVYQQSSLPWPVDNRDIVFTSHAIQNKDSKSITIKLDATPDAYKRTADVRILISRGYYLIEQIERNKVRITWQLLSDPAGNIPEWITNLMITDLPFKSLSALREQVKLPRYQKAKLQYSEKGTIIGWSQ